MFNLGLLEQEAEEHVHIKSVFRNATIQQLKSYVLVQIMQIFASFLWRNLW